jgi:mannose-6-phosphate isomerase-like protein (cupin superfamily)
MSRITGKVDNSWGYELVWTSNDNYCCKILVFNSVGSKTDMSFHKEKEKSWFVNNGKFKLTYIDTSKGVVFNQELNAGEVWHCPKLQPHQLEALEEGSSITEASTADNADDVFVIIPGNTQTVEEKNESA